MRIKKSKFFVSPNRFQALATDKQDNVFVTKEALLVTQSNETSPKQIMNKWKKTTYMVAIYLFLLELRPLEPFMTAYLTGPDANLSLNEVATVIESIKSYSSLIITLFTCLTPDYLYKPNIIFLTFWSCVSFFLMTGAPSVTQLRLSTVGIAAVYSSNVMAFCYLYAKIEDPIQFQMATGIATAAVQLGKVVGDFTAQIIVNATGIYTLLPYCNMFSLLLAVIWVCLFPSIKQKNDRIKWKRPCENSLLLEQGEESKMKYCEKNPNRIELDKECNTTAVQLVSNELWMNFKSSYSNNIVVKKSLWYIVGMGAYVMVLSNINVLYSYVVKQPGNHDVLSNGLAEAMATLSGATGAYLIGKVPCDWAHYGDIFTAFCSTLMGVLIMSSYFYNKLIYVYLTYILFGLICQMHFVIIYTEIAEKLKRQCYSLVFEFNYFGSLIVVSILTLCLIQFNFMYITIPGRFLFIGGLFFMLGIIFLFIYIRKIIKNKILY